VILWDASFKKNHPKSIRLKYRINHHMFLYDPKRMKKTFDYELRYVQACLEVLEHYLLSEEVFWPLDARPLKGEPEYPQLTLGALLLAKERLAAYPATPHQDVEGLKVMNELDRISSKWRVAWEKKAEHSFSMRLRMWSDFIHDYQTSPHENADRYAYETRLRAMLGLLLLAGKKPQAEIDLLRTIDSYLRSVLVAGDFIWETELQNGFPRDTYWYLYGSLPMESIRNKAISRH
jgi:hypothetical protein